MPMPTHEIGTVVVTGASAGVGRATAVAFAKRGWKVALIARGLEGLNGACREVESAGSEAIVLPLDVAGSKAMFAAADRIAAEWARSTSRSTTPWRRSSRLSTKSSRTNFAAYRSDLSRPSVWHDGGAHAHAAT